MDAISQWEVTATELAAQAAALDWAIEHDVDYMPAYSPIGQEE